MKKPALSRREFLKNSTLTAAAFTIVPAHVLGGCGRTAPSDMVNVGLIGSGKQAYGLYKSFTALADMKLLAAADINSKKLTGFKSLVDEYYENSELKTFKDYREMLDMEGLDAVIVMTPDHWHAIQAIDAMKAGKDVYCEKPLSHTIFEGREMVNAAKKYKKVVQTGSMQRSWDDFRHACELVVNGYLGELKKVIVSVGDPAYVYDLPEEPVPSHLDWDMWCGPGPLNPFNMLLSPPIDFKQWPQWRQYREYGGGIIADWGAHMFDIAHWGMGMDHSGPVKLIPPGEAGAKRGLKMIYENGIEMVHEDFDRGWAVRFIGTEGSLDVSRSFLDSKPEHIAQTEIKSSDKRLYYSDNHYQDWIDAIRNRTEPVADVETGHRTASICNLANIAYWLNEELEWDPATEKFSNNDKANAMKTKTYREPFTFPEF